MTDVRLSSLVQYCYNMIDYNNVIMILYCYNNTSNNKSKHKNDDNTKMKRAII